MRSSHLLVAFVFPLSIVLATSCSSSPRDAKGRPGGSSGGSSSGGGGGGGGGGSSTGDDLGGSGGSGFQIDPGRPPSNGTDDAIEPACESNCDDFPADPIVEEGASESGFGGSGGSLCIVEPQEGSMYPNGHAGEDEKDTQPRWMRPRVMIASPKAGATYKITMKAEAEANELVVYTKDMPWYMPRDIWSKLSANVMEKDIDVTVEVSGGGKGTTKFQIAPVDVGGSIVFWNANTNVFGGETTRLLGFRPTDEAVIEVMKPTDIKTTMLADSAQPKPVVPSTPTDPGAKAGQVRCIGCHTSTPDGKAVAITDHWPWNIAMASLENVGDIPDYVTPAGRLMAQSPWQGVPTFSKADWEGTKANNFADKRRRYVTSFAPRKISTDPGQAHEFWSGNAASTASNLDDLIWIDLAAEGDVPEVVQDKSKLTVALINLRGTLWDIIKREGDARGAVTPDWSHDGKTIVYTSADATSDGRIGRGPSGTKDLTICDIYTVPFEGGEATPVKGAAESGVAEYYPDFSPDDEFIAFNRVDNMKGAMYYRQDAELHVVPAKGGTATRLTANDPPACTNLKGNAVFNSWPKWAPLVKEAHGNRYYFLTFSSTRFSTDTVPGEVGKPPIAASELFLTTVKVDSEGKITTYPAVYLWNQRTLVSGDGSDKATRSPGLNLTPAWDDFAIARVPPNIPPLR